MERINELRAEIARLERKQIVAENWLDYVRSLEEISDAEKVEAFDELYTQAWDYVRLWVKKGHKPKDGDHYLYEAVIDKTLNKDIWFLIRTLANC
jgi:hypothetical protein